MPPPRPGRHPGTGRPQRHPATTETGITPLCRDPALLGYCDNTTEALDGLLRPGSAGPDTTADHLQVLGDAITAVPAKYRWRLVVTANGAGPSHGLMERLDQLATRPGRQLVYSVGWELGERERRADDASQTTAARMPAAGDKKRT